MPGSDHIHHVPIVGKPPEETENRFTLVFDTKTGKMLGRSPHVAVKQTMHRTRGDGTVTTTLTVTRVKGDQ